MTISRSRSVATSSDPSQPGVAAVMALRVAGAACVRRGWRSRLAALLIFAVFLALPLGTPAAPAPSAVASAEANGTLEQRVKAAFLFRFTEFVTWPDEALPRANAPFVIAVAGSESYAEALQRVVAGRAVVGHAVQVRRVSDLAVPPAQVLFIADAEKRRLREWLRAAPRHALIVTESHDALDHGSVINFVLAEGRVRFEISLESAEKRRLRLSSRLLALALQVRPGGP